MKNRTPEEIQLAIKKSNENWVKRKPKEKTARDRTRDHFFVTKHTRHDEWCGRQYGACRG
jgi:hypothetical protein